MSSWKQRKNTTKLPKALREELESLGKLDPRRKPSTSGGGPKGGGKSSAVGREPHRTGYGVGRGGSKPAYRPQPKIGLSRSPPKAEESFESDERLFDEEDRMIAELEKKLGMDRKQNEKLGDDDLEGLLEGIGTSRPNKKRKRESHSIKSTEHHITELEDATESSDLPDDMSDIEQSEEESEFEGFSETSETLNQPSQPSLPPSSKYIPPAARKAQSIPLSSQQEDPKLRKQIQGILNRLSESNISTVLTEIESLYSTHPRANVTSTLTTLLLTILSAQQTLLDTFVILHAGFVAALYRLIGIDFGAHLIQTLVERFDEVRKDSGKESTNLVTFLSELYNFGVVGAGLIYDLIRTFLNELSEHDTELLLKVVQNSGQQLRQDDPSALKDIVILMQSKVAAQDPASLTVRTKFMTETIINLKNNRAKAATSTSVVTSEATIRMKKFLGKMGERNLRSGGEPLRVTLSDIRNVNEKGKWWLVGASWINDELPLQTADQDKQDGDALISLAREQRMNTEIRRAVFIALMGSEDYVDASTRIILLPLKKAQRNEISRVLVHCCSNEVVYNPFYALVARRLCSPSSNPQITRVVRMGLQFNLWGAFREWGESTDAEWSEEHDDTLDETAKLRKAVNLARLYGTLVAEGVLSLQILKVLGFINLQPLTKTFLEIFFTQLILSSQGNDATSRNPEPLLQCTSKLLETIALAKGIEWYLRRKNVEKAGISTGEEKVCITWGVDILRKGIAQIFADS